MRNQSNLMSAKNYKSRKRMKTPNVFMSASKRYSPSSNSASLSLILVILFLSSLTCSVNCELFSSSANSASSPLSLLASSKSKEDYRSSFSFPYSSNSQSQSRNGPSSKLASSIVSSFEDEEYRLLDAIYHKSLNEHLPSYPHSHSSEVSARSEEKRRSKKKRSHKHLQICRREFLKPLEKRQFDADLVFTGIIERIKRNPSLKLSNGWYRANVRVKQVIKGNAKLEGSKVIVEGFGSKKICESDAKVKDSRIFLVTEGNNGRLRLNSSLIRVNLDNLKKAVAAAKCKYDP